MPWFKVDDKFHDHPKVRRLGKDKLAAVGLWAVCGSWAGDTTSDGFVPLEIVHRHDPRERIAARLVAVGLWHKTEKDGESGYQFHQWADYQPTRADIDAEREKWRERKSRQRKVSQRDTRGTEDGTPQGTPGESHADVRYPSRPDPSRPIGGHLGEEGSPLAGARETPPPPRCPKHIDHDTDQPCRACGQARKARDEWMHLEQLRAESIAADVEAARADPRQRCDHGTDGGKFQHPITGKSATCALCRTESTRDTA